MPDDVPELVRRCLSGDEAAMAELIDRFRGQVFGLCYRMLGHRQDAEDMTQEAFVRALRSLNRWDSRREFRPWLLAIAGNRCRTLLASRRKVPRPTGEVDYLPDARPDRQQQLNLAEEVRLALSYLREEYRQALVLFHEQQLGYAEIAEVLDCPVGTVKTWVHRARRELADHLRRRGVLEETDHAVRRI
ncbi:MAG TPA: sigma-70 family RNA polymerase sigma factor [Pirellulales bacterium]|nr:sigma-70 family RNA polymerase sigma factor [Pirellulales bacterium]